jgi:hypothetical protein
MGVWGYSSQIRNIDTGIEVSGQFRALSILPSGVDETPALIGWKGRGASLYSVVYKKYLASVGIRNRLLVFVRFQIQILAQGIIRLSFCGFSQCL